MPDIPNMSTPRCSRKRETQRVIRDMAPPKCTRASSDDECECDECDYIRALFLEREKDNRIWDEIETSEWADYLESMAHPRYTQPQKFQNDPRFDDDAVFAAPPPTQSAMTVEAVIEALFR